MKKYFLFVFLLLTPYLAIAAEVMIIGGGISGLTALHELKKQGIDAELYEANDQLGGRIKLATNIYDTGLYANVGAELISETDTRMVALANELGIHMQDRTPQRELEADGFLYKGNYIPKAELQKSLFENHKNALDILKSDTEEFSRDQAAGLKKFDTLSVTEYLKKNNFDGLAKDYILADLISELGVSPDKLSATVLFENFAVDLEKQRLRFLPHADEMLKVEGGTYKIIEALEKKYGSSIHKNYRLQRVANGKNGAYLLEFKTAAGTEVLDAKHVIVTTPMPNLKKIKFEVKNFPSEIQAVARNTGYANNSKLSLYFKNKTWLKENHAGSFISDLNFQIWESSYQQTAKNPNIGSLTAFIGIHPDLERPEKISAVLLNELEKMYPGITNEYLGYTLYHWKDSYSTAYRVGERLKNPPLPNAAGNIRFAGEAFSKKHAGYMEGSVETAQEAARAVSDRLKMREPINSCAGNFSRVAHFPLEQ